MAYAQPTCALCGSANHDTSYCTAGPSERAPVQNLEAIKLVGSGSGVGLLSRLQCRLGLCGGHIDHERDENGVWWVGLRCTATRTLHGRTKSAYQDKQPNASDEPRPLGAVGSGRLFDGLDSDVK